MLGIIADWASIVSLVVSLYAAWQITKVRTDVIGRARLSAISSALSETVERMGEKLSDYEANRSDIRAALNRCSADVKAASELISITGVVQLLNSLAQFNAKYSGPYNKYNVNEKTTATFLHGRLIALVGEIQNIEQRRRLGG